MCMTNVTPDLRANPWTSVTSLLQPVENPCILSRSLGGGAPLEYWIAGGGGAGKNLIYLWEKWVKEINGHKAWWKYSLFLCEKNKVFHLPCEIRKMARQKFHPPSPRNLMAAPLKGGGSSVPTDYSHMNSHVWSSKQCSQFVWRWGVLLVIFPTSFLVWDMLVFLYIYYCSLSILAHKNVSYKVKVTVLS